MAQQRHIPNLPTLDSIKTSVSAALTEDIGSGDLTAKILPEDLQAHACVIARESGVLCGCAWFDEVFSQVDATVSIEWLKQDGDQLEKNEKLCEIKGPARAILTAERTALNFLQTLSGTATTARQYANAVEGTGCRILDTRKTLPGLRLGQKYATTIGGACNHRIGLYDGILIKENHIHAAGSIRQAIETALKDAPKNCMVEVEVETLEQLEKALAAGATRIMLDNFDLATTSQAVAINNHRAELEASGNMSLENVREVAETGVDFISIGAITKNVRAVDFSLLFSTTQD